MNCRTHQETEAVARCAGCAEPCCKNCVIELAGQHYCGSCKTLALGGRVPVVGSRHTISMEAGEALRLAIIGFLCCGVILGPLAIAKANDAKRHIASDPMMIGYGKANAALWLGVMALAWFVVNIIERVITKGNL